MRAEKQLISREYVQRINSSPFFLVVDYLGVSVTRFGELRRRLSNTGSEIHVVKNSLFRIAVKEAGIGEVKGPMQGQLAVVTGQRDVSTAAKILRTFQKEFEKPKIRFGYLQHEPLDETQIQALADLPPLEVLRSKVLGLINAPAAQLARILSEPARQLVRVVQARVAKE